MSEVKATADEFVATTPKIAVARDPYFDGVRGILIILVIGIHASNTGAEFYQPDPGNWNFLYTLAIKQLLLCAVPAFVMLSGYFSSSATTKVGTSRLLPRLLRILAPYLVCCLVVAIIRRTPPLSAIDSALLGTSLGPHYFVPVILFLGLIEPFLLRPAAGSPLFMPACLAVTIIHISGAYVVHFMRPDLDWWWFMFSPTAWIGYYGLGIYLRRNPPRLSYWPALMIFAALASIGEAYWLVKSGGLTSGALDPIKFSTLIYSVAVCVIIVALRNRSYGFRFLAWFGSVSYGVFLIHELLRPKIDAVVRKVHLLYDVQPVFQLIVVLGTVVVVAALAKMCQAVLGNAASKRWFGF
jgi:peptidoglycan/LPS O-acetylase OafA/YrhL